MSLGEDSIVNASGWRAVVKRWRRHGRRALNRLLARLFGTAHARRRALDPATRRILVVRLNVRLGNILFLTPMLRTLGATLPTATIDVLIRDPKHKVLLESLPGVGNVWIQRASVSGLIRAVRAIRRQRYDLAIDPSGNSASNRTAVALCGARQRMGFADQQQWLSLTHAASRPRSRHQAIQSVELLLDSVQGLNFERFDTLAVFPAESAQTAARAQWHAAFGRRCPPEGPIIGFFAQATGRKQMPDDWWLAWYAAIHHQMPNATLLQICPPGLHVPLVAGLATVGIAELDQLAAVMARLDVFVAADSGPMHLAAAAGVPVVGLFRATAPASYAPLGLDCTSLENADLTPEKAARATARTIELRRRRGVA